MTVTLYIMRCNNYIKHHALKVCDRILDFLVHPTTMATQSYWGYLRKEAVIFDVTLNLVKSVLDLHIELQYLEAEATP
jgi:hypothetical protein